MTPQEFVTKWASAATKERAASQEHFIDLCRLFGEPTPNEADPNGEWYAFEKGVEVTGAGRGWADVWKRGHFGWEYKSKSGGRVTTMASALKQLQLYALALESPPLLVISDIDTIEIHTAFQNAVQEVYLVRLEDLLVPEKREQLRAVFHDPERLRPNKTRDQITADAAGKLAALADELRSSGNAPLAVAHFLNKILFCMFAEDAGLLRSGLFTSAAEMGVTHPSHFNAVVAQLFRAMQSGGPFGTDVVDWFNGGLFDDDITLPLSLNQIRIVRDLALMDWSQIEPAIFGTLFERGLDPSKRTQLGAHYTDPQSIMRIVGPTIVEPLLAEWYEIKTNIAAFMKRRHAAKSSAAIKKNYEAAQNALQSYLERLRNYRVLDPACGSGNFLYLALQSLKDLEHRANIEAEALGLERHSPMVGPEAVHGIEINTYAAELARVTIWIGEIQWMLRHGYSVNRNPILKPLESIEQRDAIINDDGTEPEWPLADAIVGNPPFLGSRWMHESLGEEYSTSLRRLYRDSVPDGADLVSYWFHKAHKQISLDLATNIGLVATQSIRRGASRAVLESLISNCSITDAWQDEPWINDGASVRVSLICASASSSRAPRLDGNTVNAIDASLTAREIDVLSADRLDANRGVAFQGVIPRGKFTIPGETAREWIATPNASGRSNAEYLRPYIIANDLTRRPRDHWIIDFPESISSHDAAMFAPLFEHLRKYVYVDRQKTNQSKSRDLWWIQWCHRPEMRKAFARIPRYIATPRVSKHRLFRWFSTAVIPDARLFAVARADDQSFGILHSRFHEVWSLATSSRHGVGNDPTYNAKTCFESFPFPDGLTPDLTERDFFNAHSSDIARAARTLDEHRERWINPPEWVDFVGEVIDGFPARPVPKAGFEAKLKKRTLTELYNARPTWLSNLHSALDESVAAAYGWPIDLSDDEILVRLFELGTERARR